MYQLRKFGGAFFISILCLGGDEMETLGLFIFLGCGLISFGLICFVETKSQKRFWKWRDDLLSAIQTFSCEQRVIVLTAEDFEKIKELEKKK